MAQKRLQDALDENVDFISRALRRIEKGDAPETELHNVRVYLVTTLDLIEPDPAITEAADELSRLVAGCVFEHEREVLIQQKPQVAPDRIQAVRDALSRFHQALLDARPTEQALKLGLR